MSAALLAASAATDYRAETRRLDACADAADLRADSASDLATRTSHLLAADRLRRRALLQRRAAELVAFRAIGGHS